MKIKNTLKLRAYSIVSDAVESGIEMGWRHAHKHTDGPTEAQIKAAIDNDVMLALYDIIEFEEERVAE